MRLAQVPAILARAPPWTWLLNFPLVLHPSNTFSHCSHCCFPKNLTSPRDRRGCERNPVAENTGGTVTHTACVPGQRLGLQAWLRPVCALAAFLAFPGPGGSCSHGHVSPEKDGQAPGCGPACLSPAPGKTAQQVLRGKESLQGMTHGLPGGGGTGCFRTRSSLRRTFHFSRFCWTCP